jgi:hypothetical protein
MTVVRTKKGKVIYRVDHNTYTSIERELNSILVGITRCQHEKLNVLFRDFMIGTFKDGYDQANMEYQEL